MDYFTTTAKAAFSVAIAKTLAWETARITDDPDDPGGLTRYGITARSYPSIDIRNLTEKKAARIYKCDFWRAPKIDQVAAIRPEVAIRLFDLGVMCGPSTAIRMLQRAVNAVCATEVPVRRRAAWREKIARIIGGKPLAVDGVIGPITLEVLRECPYPVALLAALKGEAYGHFKKLNPLYLPGWLNRLE